MKAQLEHHNLIWFWQKEPKILDNYPSKQLKFISRVIKTNARNGNFFWNGVHYTGYLEAIECIIRNRQAKQKLNPTVKDKTNKFLGRLDKMFPNSKLSAQISSDIIQQSITVSNKPIKADV